MKNSNQAFGYYSPKGVSKIIYLLAKVGLGFGSIKKIYSKILIKFNGNNPLDIIYHNLKFRLHPQNNRIESKIIVNSKLPKSKELNVISSIIEYGGIFLDIRANWTITR